MPRGAAAVRFSLPWIAGLALAACAAGEADRGGTGGPGKSAQLEAIVGDSFGRKVHETRYFLRGEDGTRTPLVNLGGAEAARAFAYGESGPLFLPPVPKPEQVRLAILLVNFRDDRSRPWSAEGLRREVFEGEESTAAYYREVSYGKLSVSGEIFGWYTLEMNKPRDCDDLHRILDKLFAAVDPASLLAYTNLVVAFPRICDAWDGFGTVGPVKLPRRAALETSAHSSVIWINGSEAFRSVLAHELGHNFGLHHANGCQGPPSGALCHSLEYEDPFDIMGYVHMYEKPRHMNAYHKEAAGWLPPANMAVATRSGTYEIKPLETLGEGTMLLKIPRDSGAWYYLEYRRPIGFDSELAADSAAVNGVSLRIAPRLQRGGDSHLVDTTPDARGGSAFADAPLAAGRTYEDARSKIRITALEATESGVTLRIEMTPSDPIGALALPPPALPELFCSLLTGACNL